MREGGRKTRDRSAIERDPRRRKRHQSRGSDLTFQLGDENVNSPVYESLMENYLRVIIPRVRRSERLLHI